MSQYKKSLADGQYPNLCATLTIEDGKATIILHEAFDLAPGTEIPLWRESGTMLVEYSESKLEEKPQNGHSII